MNRPSPTLVKIGIAVVALVGAYFAWQIGYVAPRDALLEQLAAESRRADAIEEKLADEFATVDRVKAAGARTLGGKLDDAIHQFRTGLGRVAESEGLTQIVVDQGQPQAQTNPLVSVRGLTASNMTLLKRDLRRQSDFFAIRGSVRGVGTLDEVFRAIAAIRAQPWVHRVEGFSIRPTGKERRQFNVRVDVATLFAPQFSPPAVAEATIALPPVDTDVVVRALAARPLFIAAAPPEPAPTPAVAQKPPTPTPPKPPPPPPYDEWRLTGIINGSSGTEVFMVNTKTGERRVVQPGGSVLDAVFIEASGERAIFGVGEGRFEVSNGQTLAARRPVG